MTRDSFVFYRSFYEAIEDLDDEQKLACYNALFKYAFDGDEPEKKGIISTVFKLARPLIDRNNENFKNGTKGGRPKTEPKPTVIESETDGFEDENPNKDKDVDVEKDKDVDVEKKEKRVRSVFVKPNIEQVREYCQEQGYSVSPEQFMSYYDSNGWKIGGKSPMKDWKAAVRTWQQREQRDPPKTAPKARQPDKWQYQDQRVYDYDALEKALLGRAYE